MKVLAAIITGGRPELAARPTYTMVVPAVKALGWDVEWVLREDHAAGYELGDVEANVYPVGWANAYAATHWQHPTFGFVPGGFHGAFTGREWAMQTAEDRGYDMVCQLDDNITDVGVLDNRRVTNDSTTAAVLRTIGQIVASTNVMLAGPRLTAVPLGSQDVPLIRPGYPYSILFEPASAARLPWQGPFEDDIMHALQYGLHPSGAVTSGLCMWACYRKAPAGVGGGMRPHYDNARGLGLVRQFPRHAKLQASKATANPNETRRGVRHLLTSAGFNPVKVTDPAGWERAVRQTRSLVAQKKQQLAEARRRKIRSRANLPG